MTQTNFEGNCKTQGWSEGTPDHQLVQPWVLVLRCNPAIEIDELINGNWFSLLTLRGLHMPHAGIQAIVVMIHFAFLIIPSVHIFSFVIIKGFGGPLHPAGFHRNNATHAPYAGSRLKEASIRNCPNGDSCCRKCDQFLSVPGKVWREKKMSKSWPTWFLILEVIWSLKLFVASCFCWKNFHSQSPFTRKIERSKVSNQLSSLDAGIQWRWCGQLG